MKRIVVACLAMLLVAPAAHAQAHEPDAKAAKAFAEMLDAYRKRPALEVKAVVGVGVGEDELASQERTSEMKLAFDRERRGKLELNGFTCWVEPGTTDEGGTIYAIHDSTSHGYYSLVDDGSPYYALFNMFVDMPFPHLAIAFGETAPDEVLMQFHQKTPWVQPTAVEDRTTASGEERRHIMLTSDFASIDIGTDPKSKLIRTLMVKITGGMNAQPGTTVWYDYKFEYTEHDKPLAAETLTFDPGERQRNDVLGALVDIPEEAPPVDGGPAGIADGAIVGREAPPFILATADGDAIDIEDLRGQVVVIDFWATWCRPCINALPLLHEVAAWARQEQLPVTIVTINTFERGTPDAILEKVREFWKAKEFTLPIAMDYSAETADAYGVQGIPNSVIIRSDGIVHAQHAGAGGDYVEQLKRDIRDAINALDD